MKDWRKSPEPIGMMGGGGGGVNVAEWRRSEDVSTRQPNSPSSINPTFYSHSHQHINSPSTPDSTNDSPLQRPRTKMDVSLAEMARRVITQKIHLYESLGDAPFSIVRFILEQSSASKLWTFEEETPEYIQYTSYIWQKHCLRDFKDIQQACSTGKIDCETFTHWRELYHAKVVQDFEAKEAATARIKEKYAALRADKQANQVRIVTEIPSIKNRKRSSFANSIVVNRNSGSNSTQGQRMLHKARRQAETHAQGARVPFHGIRPAKIRTTNVPKIASSWKTIAQPTSVPLSSTNSSNQNDRHVNFSKQPPGFERKATFFEADKLENDTIEQLTRAMSNTSGTKRVRNEGVEVNGEYEKEKRSKTSSDMGTDTEQTTSFRGSFNVADQSSISTKNSTFSSSKPQMTTRRPLGNGISVRTKKVSTSGN